MLGGEQTEQNDRLPGHCASTAALLLSPRRNSVSSQLLDQEFSLSILSFLTYIPFLLDITFPFL